MKKWGHVSGQALKEGGLTSALSAEHFQPSSTSSNLASANLSKRARAKAAARAASTKWKQAPNARGRIIDQDRVGRQAVSRERFGDESRIAVIEGLGQGPDVVPDGLVETVGERASDVGIVERIVLHLVDPPPADERECLRVFVVFSGMAGAYRFVTGTTELDGRPVVSHNTPRSCWLFELTPSGCDTLTKAGSSAATVTASSKYVKMHFFIYICCLHLC